MFVFCPRCRTRFQVPEQAAGKTATCSNQRCHAKFVIPSLPAVTGVGAAGGFAGGMVPAARPPREVSLPNPSELTIQLDTSSRRPSSVTIQAAAPSNSMGIVSLVVGILALLLCWLPMMNRLGYVIGGLGVALGLLGMLVASQQRGASIGFPIGGLVLSIVGLTLAIQLDQGLQSLKTAVTNTFSEGRGAKTRQPAGKPGRPGADTGVARADMDEGPKRWADATKTIVTRDSISLKINAVRLGTIARIDISGKHELGPYLVINALVGNKSDTKKVDFQGWSNELNPLAATCRLTDEHGNDYRQMRSGISGKWDGQVLRETIAPRGAMNDVLVFEPPVSAAQELHLEIPGEPLGCDGWYRFAIPRRMFEVKQGSAAPGKR